MQNRTLFLIGGILFVIGLMWGLLGVKPENTILFIETLGAGIGTMVFATGSKVISGRS